MPEAMDVSVTHRASAVQMPCGRAARGGWAGLTSGLRAIQDLPRSDRLN
jgi:hypothetical protein